MVRVISLGSGSSGNALLVQAGQTTVLVDAGFTARTLVGRLRQAGVAPTAINAIFLTHEHSDHASGAVAFARQYGAALIADRRTLNAVFTQARNARPYDAILAGATLWSANGANGGDGGDATANSAQADAMTSATSPTDEKRIERVEFAIGATTRIGSLEVRSFAVSHDAVAPCGYLLGTAAWRVCFVTDTGEITPAILEAMRAAHLLVIEANHDRARLLSGPYPLHLKRRILSPTGHLSNEQTGQALGQTLDDTPRWVWLSHLSRTNNTPDLARAQVREYLRTLGLGQVAPQIAPPGVGPTWDSATLLAPSPIAAAAPHLRA